MVTERRAAVQSRRDSSGRTYAWLADGNGNELGRLTIEHLTMCGPAGPVPIAAVGNVFTHESARGRGIARLLMESIADLAPEAALSVLFGIDGYYLPLGYRSCGDEWLIELPLASRDHPHAQRLTPRRSARVQSEAIEAPRRALHPSYIGAIHRSADSWSWMSGTAPSPAPGAIRAGTLYSLTDAAYAWIDHDHGVATDVRRGLAPGTLLVAELGADSVAAATELLAHLADIGTENTPLQSLAVPHPMTGWAAQLVRQLDAQIVRQTRPAGGLMIKVLNEARARATGIPDDTDAAARLLHDAGMFVPLADRW